MLEKGLHNLMMLGFLLLFPAVCLAEKPRVVLNMSVQKEVIVKDAAGKLRTEWREAQSFQPGELLKYTIAYRNEGKAEARDVVIVDPIPENTVYIPNGAEGKDTEISFSLDGKHFQVPPLLKYTAKTPGARDQEYFATPEMYTHIRWKLTKAVSPGGGGTVSFKVKVK